MGMTAEQLSQRIADERLAGRLIVEYLLDDLARRVGIEREGYITAVREANAIVEQRLAESSAAADAETAARLGNEIAREGVDRCDCGCKYWEGDYCVSCGSHVSRITQRSE